MRVLCKSLLSLSLVLVFCIIGAWYFLQVNAARIIDAQTREFAARTGLKISVGPINVDFLPLAAVSIMDLNIKGDALDIKIPWCALRPNFFRLFHGEFLPAEVILRHPSISAQFPVDLANTNVLEKALANLSGSSSQNSPYLAQVFSSGSYIQIFQCSAHLAGLNGSAWKLDNFYGSFILSDGMKLEGESSFSGFYVVHQDKLAASIDNMRLSGSMRLDRPLTGANELKLVAKLRLGNILPDLFFSGEFQSGGNRNFLKAALRGDLHLQSAFIPLELTTELDFDASARKLKSKRLDWRLGADSGTLAVEAGLPENLRDFSISGDFTARRLSLTQWLGFARNLAPGLQISLDNIFNVKMAFNLNAKSLEVPALEAVCNASLFRGKGGVESFAKPVVFLDIATERTNLGHALGEAVGESPRPPWFNHAPLTPVPDNSPIQKGEIGVDYDINITANILDYGLVDIQKAKLRIMPGKIDENGLEEILLLGSGVFYDGKINGKCVLGGPASQPISITGEAQNVNGAKLVADLPFFPFNKGRFNCNISAQSEGKQLKTFLANLKGPVKITGTNAQIGKNLLFSRLDTSVNIKSASYNGSAIYFDGSWNLAGISKDYKVESSSRGRMRFDANGATFSNLPFQASAVLNKDMGFLPSGFSLQANGAASLQMAKNELSLTNAHISVKGLTLNGHANINYKKTTLSGVLASATLNTGAFLNGLGIKGSLPSFLTPKSIKADFSANAESFSLKEMHVALGASRINGSLSANFGKNRPALRFDLAGDKLQLSKVNSNNYGKNWNFEALRQFDAEGTMRIGAFTGWNVSMRDFIIPLRLRDGQLTISLAKAKIYDGSTNIAGILDFGKSLGFDLKVNALGINLGQAARDQKLNLLFTGTGDFHANLKGHATSSSQLVSALNGDCRFLAIKGSWQELNKNRVPKGTPTRFDKMEASAKIVKGRLDTSDFRLIGPGLQVSGKGYANLAKRDLDYKLDVNMRGVPDFPLYIYGSFDNPKVSIGAGKLILNALGSIPTGIGNILGAMGRGIGNLFE